MLKPMLVSFGIEMIKSVVDKFDPFEVVSIEKLREEIGRLMSEKLLFLTPAKVKEILEKVIRKHLVGLYLSSLN